MRLKRNLFLMNTYTVFGNMLFILPVLLPYYRDQMGLGFHELLVGEAFFAATMVLFEVPSGWISDIWERKHTLATGVFFELIGFCILLLATTFPMAVLAQIIIGIGISLCSGTNSALVYDSLLSAGKEHKYSQKEGKRIALALYTTAASGIAGGLAYEAHHQLPVMLCVLGMLGSLIAACLLDEPERHKEAPEHHPIKDMAITMRYALHGHVEVAFIIFFSAAIFCATKIVLWIQQPYYLDLGISEAWFGVLMAIGFILGGLSSHFAYLLDGRISNIKALSIFWMMLFTVCVACYISTSWVGVLLLGLGGTAIFGAARPRVYDAINNHVDSSRRATVLSTQNLMVSLFFIPMSAVMGYVSDLWGTDGVFAGLMIWLVFAGILLALLFISKKKKAQL